MKNTQRGFIVPLLIILVIVGVGVYFYEKSKEAQSNNPNPTVTQTSVKENTASNYTTPANNISNQNSDWKIETNPQYSYQISYPPENITASLKVKSEITVEADSKTAACKSNQLMSDAKLITVNGTKFYFTPLQANGGEFVSVYTSVNNNLCYQILFRVGDRKSTINSPETKNATELINQIISTFKFSI